jgi:hypothetical protein
MKHITKIKNSTDGFKKQKRKEERVKKLKDKTTKIIQSEHKRK